MIPMAYELKRFVAQKWPSLRYGDELAGLVSAPVYLFPDQGQLDADEVDALAQQYLADIPLCLPHEQVLFEVPNRIGNIGSLVAYAFSAPDRVDAFLFLRTRSRAAWSDVLCRASFLPGMVADVELHPSLTHYSDRGDFSAALTGTIWRAAALLAQGSSTENRAFPVTRRPKLQKHGISGWTYRVINIDPARVRAAIAASGGTHASPRWHIRRGHWRTLGDGRRVFVRECEVGDSNRGCVVKDYLVVSQCAA